MFAIAGSLSGTWACGGRTGIWLFDEVGADSGAPDGTPESSNDVMVADVGRDAPSCMEAPDSGSAPPSCAPGGAGMTNCGPAGSGSESCCASLEVCKGAYYRTYTNDGGGPSGEADPATVSAFRLDKYLVTVGRFRRFVAAWNNGSGYYPTANSGKHTHLHGGLGLAQAPNVTTGQTYESGWDATDWNSTTDIDPTTANLTTDCTPYNTWTSTVTTNENLPINCVTWFESYAFCIWDGGFLPSEAEWEYAAAGGSQQLQYPWGSAAPGTVCPGTGCEYAIYNCDYPSGSRGCAGVTNIAPVGYASLGAATWGQFDLAGEVYEWNLDWYASPYADPSTDGVYLTAASSRVVRGSDFDGNTSDLLPPSRGSFAPTSRSNAVGFRCARTP
jgi:formylglycine-generating enzyme